jgi:hypothetical protein
MNEVCWIVQMDNGLVINSTLRSTRKESIDEYCRLYDPPVNWRDEYKKGMRCIKVKIIKAQEPSK